jgi:hypothetical protein
MRVVIVAPLKNGARSKALDLIRSGPPFEPEAASLERHHVFLTDQHAVFLFEADTPNSIARLAADAAVWVAATAWQDLLAGPPEVAEDVYSWLRPGGGGLSFAATPGPGDSEGGDVFSP